MLKKYLKKSAIIVLAILLLFGYVGVVRPVRQKGLLFWNLSEKQIMERCSQYMLLGFPPSTRFVAVQGKPLMDINICLKVEMDKKELDVFLKHSPFAGKPLSENIMETGFPMELHLPWWTPSNARKFKIGTVKDFHGTKNLHDYLSMFIDLDDENKVIIYLEYLTVG